MKEVNEGFSYSKRAFELLKYGLKYEENIQIPNDIQDRMVIGSISEKSIKTTNCKSNFRKSTFLGYIIVKSGWKWLEMVQSGG